MKTAQIDLKPLTVFVGANNTGKSIVASTIYAAAARWFVLSQRSLVRAAIRRTTAEGAKETVDLLGLADLIDSAESPSLEMLPEGVMTVLQEVVLNALENFAFVFSQEIERTTGADASELRRQDARKSRHRSSILIESERPRWLAQIALASSGHRNSRLEPPLFDDIWALIDESGWTRLRDQVKRAGVGRMDVLAELSAELVRSCFVEFPSHTRYLPAARSGLMQFSYRGAAGQIIRGAPAPGFKPVTGVIADFLSSMVEVDRQVTGAYGKIASALEREILGGVINVLFDDLGVADIQYQSTGGDFPLTRTSSMIAELAPVVVYLRHILQQHDLLIVEEPEAHLHPQAQVSFAKNIVRLVRGGLSTCVTTHSEFFLQQLNNSITAEGISPIEATAVGFDEQSRIPYTDVAAYLFCPTGDGTVVEQLKVTQQDGIPESSFADVAERLYRESVALEYGSE